MDTTETYVKMCEKAVEIQKLAPSIVDTHNFWYPTIPSIWLPRQDQLQEMVKDDLRVKLFDNKAHMTLKIFYDTVNMNFDSNAYYWEFTSMEQLWLAFVKEKYGKTWNGEDWVTEIRKVEER